MEDIVDDGGGYGPVGSMWRCNSLLNCSMDIRINALIKKLVSLFLMQKLGEAVSVVEDAEDVSDASDWPMREMREFERKLRCPICQDFFRGALLLRPCSHNCTTTFKGP
jgi:hypothetical protein